MRALEVFGWAVWVALSAALALVLSAWWDLLP